VGARTDHFGVVVLGHDLLGDGGEEVEGVLLLHVEQQLGRHDVLLSSEREKRKRREVVLSPAPAPRSVSRVVAVAGGGGGWKRERGVGGACTMPWQYPMCGLCHE
jgi:hypothetical protein